MVEVRVMNGELTVWWPNQTNLFARLNAAGTARSLHHQDQSRKQLDYSLPWEAYIVAGCERRRKKHVIVTGILVLIDWRDRAVPAACSDGDRFCLWLGHHTVKLFHHHADFHMRCPLAIRSRF